jgi:Tol biopolymer transport system component
MEEDGSDVRQLTNDPDSPIGDAMWSPDGNKIAINASADPKNRPNEWAGAIYIMNADGTGRYQLTHPPLGHHRYVGDLQRNYVWSPDGQKIAFSRMRPPEALGTFDVFVVDLETGVETLVSKSKQVRDWHPHRDELLIAFSDNRRRLGLLDLTRDSVKVFGDPDFNYGTGRISPDGSKMVYNKEGNLYVFDFMTGEEVLLFEEASPHPNAWSSSGEKVLFQTWKPSYENRKVYIINVETKETLDITPYRSPESWIWVSSWRRR